MLKLSVVIITFNEERNIRRCLESVKDIADDIVVVDSGSTDKTEDICKIIGVNFISKPWGGYSVQKNFANAQAKSNWILSLDADEELSPELVQSIQEARLKDQPEYYKINRLSNYCGKWIKHGGWYPDIKLRIFDRKKSEWQGMIHETLTNENKIPATLLKGYCHHYTYYNKAEHIAQARKFSSISAHDLFAQGKKSGLFRPVMSSLSKFIMQFYFRFGFLDGIAGFRIAWISAKAAYWKYKELKDLWHNK